MRNTKTWSKSNILDVRSLKKCTYVTYFFYITIVETGEIGDFYQNEHLGDFTLDNRGSLHFNYGLRVECSSYQ